MHISFTVRPRSFFVHRVLTSVGMPRIAAGDHFAGRMANPVRLVALGPEFRANLEFWRWFVDEGVDARGGVLSVPMCHLLERPARRTLFSDASKTAVGGYCLETGVYWRHDLTAHMKSYGFTARVSTSAARTTYLSTCLNVWAWLCRHFSSCLRVPIDRQRREIVLCCEETTRPP